MCGIVGVFKNKSSVNLVIKGLSVLRNRGRDGFGVCTEKDVYFSKDLDFGEFASENALGHCLFSLVHYVKQPLIGEGRFVANCEIYNWRELDRRYNLGARNDSDLIFKLIERRGEERISSLLSELDGVYAFAYWRGDNFYMARDILGVKPIWYTHQDGFAFASEKKALERMGYVSINELNPRRIIKYNLKKNKLEFIKREFFSIHPEHEKSMGEMEEELSKLLLNSIKKRIPDKRFGVLFSGGLDSTLFALILKKFGCDFTCYTSAFSDSSEDLIYSEKIAKELGFRLKVSKIDLSEVERYLKIIVPLIEDSNVVKVGVALTLFPSCESAKRDNLKVVFSGLGSEDIFAGYRRHKESENVNEECLSGLIKLYERDTYRDDVVSMFNNLELRVPFLDHALVEYALKIPAKYKLAPNKDKIILRNVARKLGLKEEFALRKRKAAQYGSKFDRAIQKLASMRGFKYKSEYLKTFYKPHNLKLGALFSSGKDSTYALYIMLKQNYSVNCLISMKSKNPFSYMFHTPNIELTHLQAEAMGIPLIEGETPGEKEEELEDLKNTLEKAIDEYKIEGVVSGALFSNYQRRRIEKVCDELGLKIFSPLWHMNQETEMREILENGFEIIFSSVSALGLDKSLLGRKITKRDVDKLSELKEKFGLNVAGEGGEFETLVLDAPIFKKRIKILDSEILEEDENTARFYVKKAILEEKV